MPGLKMILTTTPNDTKA